jgi:hypothetical protein
MSYIDCIRKMSNGITPFAQSINKIKSKIEEAAKEGAKFVSVPIHTLRFLDRESWFEPLDKRPPKVKMILDYFNGLGFKGTELYSGDILVDWR